DETADDCRSVELCNVRCSCEISRCRCAGSSAAFARAMHAEGSTAPLTLLDPKGATKTMRTLLHDNQSVVRFGVADRAPHAGAVPVHGEIYGAIVGEAHRDPAIACVRVTYDIGQRFPENEQ